MQIRGGVGNGWVEEIVLDGTVSETTLARAVDAARQVGRRVRIAGRYPKEDLPSELPGESWLHQSVDGQSSWLLVRRHPTRWERFLKRLLDLVLAVPLVIMLSPVFGAIAVAVRLSSSGPILYRWRVLGRNGRPFTGYKFRTMVRDADQQKSQLRERNEMVGPVFKLKADPRVTRLGRWLRRYSLDELPQLWNVIRGDMTLVGPRPVFRDEYRHFELWQMRKLSVTPGVTCLWQVGGRNAIKGIADWARLDLRYIDNWSVALDLKILVLTVGAVVKGTGV